MFQLKNRIVWIIGASSGIGAAVARELGREGSIVVLSARRADQLTELVESIRAAGGKAHGFPLDITDRPKVIEAAKQIEKQIGLIDVLIANAGIHQPTDVKQFNSAEYAEIMAVNYFGSLHAIEAVVSSMLARGSGYIVGVASVAGFRGLPLAGAYCASKAALITFLESLRFDLWDTGVAVSIVTPGFVKTPLTDRNTFAMPFLMDVEPAAKVFVRGLRKQKRLIHFPWQFTLLMMTFRVLPYWLYERLVRNTVKR